MTNHIHLALQTGDIPLSRGMQNLSFRYTRWVNWRQKRTGHLFQDVTSLCWLMATVICWNWSATSISIRYGPA
jgi:hypothetical protein